MRNWKRLAAVALLSLFVAVAGCAETTSPLEFPDWMLPVPEGTPVREYAPVPRDQRDPGAIVLTEDLVIGGDPESIFYSAPRIEVGSDGTIYALDTQDRSVRAFEGVRDTCMMRRIVNARSGGALSPRCERPLKRCERLRRLYRMDLRSIVFVSVVPVVQRLQSTATWCWRCRWATTV